MSWDARIRAVHDSVMGDCLALKFDYSKPRVDQVTAAISSTRIRWDSSIKVWFVRHTEVELRAILAPLGGDLKVDQNLAAGVPAANVGAPAVPPQTRRAPSPPIWSATIPIPNTRSAPGPAPRGAPAPRPQAPPPEPSQGGPTVAGANFFARRYATGEDYAVLYLVPSAPFQVVRAAYRALAAMLHPDQGGDAQQFQTVNKAFERIEKAQGA